MKIVDVVDDPGLANVRYARRDELWAKVREVSPRWVVVDAESQQEANRIRTSAGMRKGFDVRMAGLSVWIRDPQHA